MPDIDLIVPAGSEPAATVAASPAPQVPPATPDEAAVRSEGALGADRQAALRALRNLEATEARLERNARREVEEARGKLVQELLPVLDNLDRTIHAADAHPGDRSASTMLDGVRLVRQQFEGVLRNYGVERVDAVDQRFDPGLHEAIGVTPISDPRRHGTVVHQAEPGYRFAGKLLRPAKVNVGKFVPPPPVVHRPLWR
ncbi:MAG TPA: nucleotide exchange factor GrpE [Kofleriaceae bacterium]|jgi:molecular chaperone GrpE (heat shock protein)|nr:nucleotide exchange factor GrpE [Kofleriaceae bacterium]